MNASPGPRSAPTIRDVARLAGVSRATAARALGRYGAVSEDARRRVLEAAESLGYSFNSLARAMITGTTNMLALVVADIENRFFARISRGFGDAARAEGFEVIVANTDENIEVERAVVKALLEKRVDGLAIAPASRLGVDHLEAASAGGAHVVLVDRYVPGLKLDSALVDSRAAADQAVSALIEAGHRRIALVTGASPEELARSGGSQRHLLSTGKDRINGYRAALRRAGVPVTGSYVKMGDFHPDAAKTMTRELLALPQPPTAIFATDSNISLGVVEALQDAGVVLPDRMSVLGFDDSDWARVVRPRLTVMEQPVYELGQLAAQLLIDRIRGNTGRPRRHHLPARLIRRESVVPPAGPDGPRTGGGTPAGGAVR